MLIALRAIAVLFVAIGLFLIYAVIHALTSAGGARAGVAIGYVIGAALLGFLAFRLWAFRSGRRAAA